MTPKTTLRGRGAFDRVFSSGKRLDGTLLQCIYTIQAGEGIKAGFAVSSRHFGAVRRNRLRRLMREAFSLEKGGLIPLLAQRRLSASIVFTFRLRKEAQADFLKLEPVRKDMAALCRGIGAKL